MSVFTFITDIIVRVFYCILDSWPFLFTFFLICFFLRRYYMGPTEEINVSRDFTFAAAGILGTFFYIFYVFG